MKSEVQAARFLLTLFPGPALEILSWIWVRRSCSILRLVYCVVSQLLRICSVRVQVHRWRNLRCHHLVADDYHLEASGSEYRAALLVFFVFCDTVGIHLSWHKISGGDVTNWVGFEMLHRSYKLGVSQRRADWFVRSTRTTADQKTVHMAAFEEGLGRVMYVAGALEHERAFLAPPYRFMTMHPRHSIQTVPLMCEVPGRPSFSVQALLVSRQGISGEVYTES